VVPTLPVAGGTPGPRGTGPRVRMPPGSAGHPTEAYDFRTLDFERLWAGRDQTTLLEREVVRRSLARAPSRRVLEVGPGHGRITPVLREWFEEYVAVDLTADFLDELRRREPELGSLFVADAANLPFADASFTAVSMVRVYNFLLDPDRVLSELYRVLVPGGALVFSFHPVPSLGTLFEDLRHSLAERPPDGFVPITFRRREILLPRRSRVAGALRRAGFIIGPERVTGLEDFGPGHRIPLRTLLGLSEATSGSSLLPHRFVRADRPGRFDDTVPPMGLVLACPRCRASWSRIPKPGATGLECPSCGHEFEVTPGGLPNLTLPPGTSPYDRTAQ
jgi:SAM-dependent methyltransferase